MERIMGWRSYVVAPVALGSQTTALLHAARDRGPLEAIHRDLLWKFAAGLAAVHESATLRRRLRGDRQRTRRFLHGLDVRLAGFAEDAVRFGSHTSRMGSPSSHAMQASPAGESVLADVLTRREIEILRLLADGLTNRAIADLLVVSNGTVKFHVNRILRKLRAANRAEAVSRYLTLAGMPARRHQSAQ
jgi:DNA-binding CsgD family transcriptional regulator